MTIAHVFTGIPVADYPAARAWYERLFGGPPDLVPHEQEAAWRLAGDLCWVYVVADRERAGNALLTVLVDDLDAVVDGLTARGIDVAPIEPVGGMTRARVTDADGNMITYAAQAAG
jgi:catechol 2,3-dioxygenase-like lactoylglutathione lyase family enzyme